MQTVWSRVAQTRCMCNCPSCFNATNTFTRRTATAAAKRRVRTGDVFTVFASSLAASATLLDSKKKDARREHWDRLINEARAQVHATEVQQQDRLALLLQDGVGETSEGDEADSWLKSFWAQNKDAKALTLRRSRPDLKFDAWGDVFDWASQQDTARTASGFEDWKGLPLEMLRTLSSAQLERLLRDDGLLRRFYGGPDCGALVHEKPRYNFSAKKVRTLEYSVAKLVLNLLLCSSKPRSGGDRFEDPSASLSNLSGKGSTDASITKVASDILSPTTHLPEDIPAQKYAVQGPASDNGWLQTPLLDERDIQRRIAHLDSRLVELVSHPGNITDPMFFEDFESPAAPRYCGSVDPDKHESKTAKDEARNLNISLFKILEGMRCGMDPSSSISKICHNLLTSKRPPNLHTYNMLLVQFCHLDDSRLVKSVLRSMRESHIRPNEITHSTLLRYYIACNDGTAFTDYVLRMEGYNGGLAVASPHLEILPITRHQYVSFKGNKAKRLEKAHMNGELYESLIIGSLRFYGNQAAMYNYRNMISEGWKAGTEILTAILKSCYQKYDWEAGICVWNQIAASAEGANTASYQWMLYLCQACGQKAAYDQILQLGLDTGALPLSMLENLDPVRSSDTRTPLDDVQASQLPKMGSVTSSQTSISEADPTIQTAANDTALLPSRDESQPIASRNNMRTEAATLPPETPSLDHVLEPPNPTIQLTAVQGTPQPTGSHTQTTRQENHNLTKPLSAKIKQLNIEDPLKMNGKEYNAFVHKQRGERRLRKHGNITSRTLYEKYKADVRARLEGEGQVADDADSQRRGLTSSGLESSPQRVGMFSDEDDHLPHLVESDAPPRSSMPQNMPFPTSWHEVDEASDSVVAHLRG